MFKNIGHKSCADFVNSQCGVGSVEIVNRMFL